MYSLYYRRFCTVVLSLQYFIALSQSTLQCKVDTVLSNWPLQYVQFILQTLLHSSSLQHSACRGVLFPHWHLHCTGQCIAMYFPVQGSTLQCKVYAVLSHKTLLFFHTSLCRVLYSVITLYVKLTLFSHPGLFTEQYFTVLSPWPPHLNFDKAGGQQ